MKLKLEKENEKKFRHKNIIEEDPQYQILILDINY